VKSVRESTIVKNWLIFFLCATIGGIVLAAIFGGAIGMVIGFVMGMRHVPIDDIQATVRPFGYVAGLIGATLMSYLSYRWTVGRLLKSLSEEPPHKSAGPNETIESQQ
jgi:NADH:ubiquinone oxidoreductase subunit 6 (subunit J)